MALFSRKKKEEKKEAPAAAGAPAAARPVKTAKAPAPEKPTAAAPASYRKRAVDYVLLSPRVTEKATDGNAVGCYVFDIPRGAGKHDIRAAVIARYGVTPRRIRTTVIKAKNVKTRSSQKAGVKAGGKKAYVYLKAGDKIELA